MDFYTQQATRRWHSALLLIVFVLTLLAMGALIHVVITAASVALGQGGSFAHPSTPAVAMICLVWLTMIAGSVFRLIDVRAGGSVMALRFGAVHTSDRPRPGNEAQLLNVVAELSIASTAAQPDVYVLRNESSINAFVLGNSDSRPVIVLTRGALDALDRDQLQAVVAHEFAHIANGDLDVNMRLLVTMGGLMAIDEVGRLLLAKGATDSVHPGTLVGGLLCAIGTIGVVAGKLICAAFSRQREYLADATAVQYTRNPFALAAALHVVSEHSDEPALHSLHVRELAHLCFQAGSLRGWLNKQGWFRSMFASHPDLVLRIKAVEPHFDVKRRKVSRVDSQATIDNKAVASIPFIGNASNIQAVSIDAVCGQAENSVSVALNPVLSDRILLLLPNESMCLAALFALFVHDGEKPRHDYLKALSERFNKEFNNDVKKVLELIPGELAKDQFGVISHASEMLNNRISTAQRQKIALKLERLLSENGNYQLMDYARVQLIRRKLLIEFPIISVIARDGQTVAKARKAKKFDSMGREFALLLSLMVESSGASPTMVDEQFKRVLKCYTQDSYPRRTAREAGIVDELEAAFQTLYVQPYSIRHAFVQHCIEIMRHDGYIMPTERALLDLFAASLGCEELIAA